MRRVTAIVAGVLVLGLVGSMTLASAERRPKNRWGVFATSGDAASVGRADGDEKRIVVIARNEVGTDIDNPPQGFSQGDEFVGWAQLYKGQRLVGRLDFHGVFTQVDLENEQVAVLVTFSATLPGGQITGTGAQAEESNTFKAAITGGTGRYDEAGGDVRVIFTSEDEAKLIFDVEDLD